MDEYRPDREIAHRKTGACVRVERQAVTFALTASTLDRYGNFGIASGKKRLAGPLRVLLFCPPSDPECHGLTPI